MALGVNLRAWLKCLLVVAQVEELGAADDPLPEKERGCVCVCACVLQRAAIAI